MSTIQTQQLCLSDNTISNQHSFDHSFLKFDGYNYGCRSSSLYEKEHDMTMNSLQELNLPNNSHIQQTFNSTSRDLSSNFDENIFFHTNSSINDTHVQNRYLQMKNFVQSNHDNMYFINPKTDVNNYQNFSFENSDINSNTSQQKVINQFFNNLEQNRNNAQNYSHNNFQSIFYDDRPDNMKNKIQIDLAISSDVQHEICNQFLGITRNHHDTEHQDNIVSILKEIECWHSEIKEELKLIKFGINENDFFIRTNHIFQNEIYHWRQKIELFDPTNDSNKMPRRNLKYENFCFIDNCDKCSFSHENLTIKSTYASNKGYILRTGIIFPSDEIEFLFKDYMAKYEQLLKINFSEFYQFFSNQQREIHEMLSKMKLRKIRFKDGIKMEIFMNLFHDFKLSHLKFKMILIPEFFSMILSLLKQNKRFYIEKNNTTTMLLFFYLQTFNNFFDALSNCALGMTIQMQNSTSEQKNQIFIISLFIKMHLIEPILLLIFKPQRVLYLYCFHIFSSLVAKSQHFWNLQYIHSKKISFLKFCDWCICIFDNNICSEMFLYCYDKSEILELFNFNWHVLFELSKFLDIVLLESNIIQSSTYNDEYIQDFLGFSNSCAKICEY